MKKAIAILTILFFVSFSFGQTESTIWYFGEQAGLDFNSGSPVPLNDGQLVSRDESSTMTDEAGNLLFYTNGVTVYNRIHAIMDNGGNIGGSNNGGQCALIVPKPQSLQNRVDGTQTEGGGLYYIFTVGQFDSFDGFRYSVVDMGQNNGLGSVVEVGTLLLGTSTERIDATYNSADNSYWIVTHEWNSNNFVSYHLTENGFNVIPVVSSVGTTHMGGSPNGYNAMGQLTISEDGSQLVCGIFSMGAFELFDFDINTGIVSNPKLITGYTNSWGTAFSPDGSKLYITEWYGIDIWQFDLNAGSITDIENSAQVIGTTTILGQTGGYGVGFLELGPDNKLYAAKYGQTYISVINQPNNLGTACGFVDNGVFLGSANCNAGLSRSAIRFNTAAPATALETDFDNSMSANVYPNPAQESFTVSVKNPGKSLTVTILDAFGKKIESFNANSNFTLYEKNINSKSYSSGLYIIVIDTKATRTTHKIQIN